MPAAGVHPVWWPVFVSFHSDSAAGAPSVRTGSRHSSIPGVGDGRTEIPFPRPGDRVVGGHAVLCVGYDDARVVHGLRGALLVRNSWGAQWGEAGYAWLPMQYVLAGLATDWWSMVRAEFLDLAQFE